MGSEWNPFVDIDPNYAKSFLAFPFLMLCSMFTLNENINSVWDQNVLCFHQTAWARLTWVYSTSSPSLIVHRNDFIADIIDLKVIFLKIFEDLLGFCGSFGFYYVLAIYSSINTWEDVLNLILNLLAYSFVLEADELAYSCFASRHISPLLVRLDKPELNIFEMKVNVVRAEGDRWCGPYLGMYYPLIY